MGPNKQLAWGCSQVKSNWGLYGVRTTTEGTREGRVPALSAVRHFRSFFPEFDLWATFAQALGGCDVQYSQLHTPDCIGKVKEATTAKNTGSCMMGSGGNSKPQERKELCWKVRNRVRLVGWRLP